ITRVDHLLSIFRKNSEISRLNRGAGRWPVQVTPEVVRLLAFAKEVWERTGGAFDPTVYALMEGWGWYRPRPEPPTEEEVAAMREAVGFGTISLDPRRRRVRLHRSGVRIDLGGIGKGHAMDCAIAVLRRMGIQRALINAGGELYALGDGDRSAPFPVAVFTPSRRVRIDKPFPLQGAAVASSGNDERSIRWEDLTIGHLFDPRTGYPATAVEGASVLAPTATAADAYSTAVFVLGPQAGARLIEETPGLEGLIVKHPGAGGRKVPWRSRNWPTPKRL
ncbi:MAG: FAD:protein FMN transferase, partial [bacterium]